MEIVAILLAQGNMVIISWYPEKKNSYDIIIQSQNDIGMPKNWRVWSE